MSRTIAVLAGTACGLSIGLNIGLRLDVEHLSDRVSRVEQQQPASPHECAPPTCRILPAPQTSASPSPRVTPTRASRSRQLPARPSTTGRTAAGSLLDVTCYTPTGARTASGTWPEPGTAAGNRWPFGTRLHVQTVGEVVITDSIGHGSDLDLFFTSPDSCRLFGRQRLHVEVLP